MADEKIKARIRLKAAYIKGGATAVYELWNRFYDHLGKWAYCIGCDAETPHMEDECQVCGL